MKQKTNANTQSYSNQSRAFKIYSARELNDDNSVRPKDVISGGLLVPNGITLLHGKAKAGKTYLAMQMGLNIASATPWLGNEIAKRKKVFYLQAELPYYPMRDRVKTMLLNYEHPSAKENFQMSEPRKLDICDEDDYKILNEIITQEGYKVVIIDPLVYFHEKNENSNDEMSSVMSRFRDLVNETDISLIIIHHDGKGGEMTGGDASRGASAIFGAVDSDIRLLSPKTPKGGGAKYQNMECSLRHAASPEPKHLYFSEETLLFSTEHATNDISKLKKIIARQPSTTKSELIKAVMESLECGKSKAYALIGSATQNRSISVSPEGIVSVPDSVFC